MSLEKPKDSSEKKDFVFMRKTEKDEKVRRADKGEEKIEIRYFPEGFF